MASGDTKTNQYLDIAAHGSRADLQRGCCNTRTQDLIMDVAERIITEEETRAREDGILQDEIDELKNNPDVTDIVATYAALQNYDTSQLTDKDIIRVLVDETHQGASTYYRWNAGSATWTYIGEVGDYYTKSQTDVLLSAKQDKLTSGEGISISAQDVISATNTGKARVLTTADYNANKNNWSDTNPANFNCIALWRLESGLYAWETLIPIYVHKFSTVGTCECAIVSQPKGVENLVTIMTPKRMNYGENGASPITVSIVWRTSETLYDEQEVLSNKSVIDRLDKTLTNMPLSANQGKVLNEKIEARIAQNAGAPTTSTAGTVGKLLEDTTNGALYMLTSITSVGGQSVYHWEKIAPITTLTDAQYNALWSNPNPLTSLLTTISTGTGV